MQGPEKEVWLKIIKLYEEMSFLWDKNDEDHLNRKTRHDGFQLLLDIYKEFDKNGTVSIVKKRLENMRTTYNRELKKVKASKLIATDADDIYVPSLWYYELFHFLQKNDDTCSDGIDSLDDFDEDGQSSSQRVKPEQMLSMVTDTTQTSTPKKKRRTPLLRKQEEVTESAKKLKQTKDEEWDVIGKSITIQLKDLDERQLIITQKLISDTLFYAKMGKLTEDSCISLAGTSHQN